MKNNDKPHGKEKKESINDKDVMIYFPFKIKLLSNNIKMKIHGFKPKIQ